MAHFVEIQVLLHLDLTLYLLASPFQMCKYEGVISLTTVQQHFFEFVIHLKQFLVRYSVEGEEH